MNGPVCFASVHGGRRGRTALLRIIGSFKAFNCKARSFYPIVPNKRTTEPCGCSVFLTITANISVIQLFETEVHGFGQIAPGTVLLEKVGIIGWGSISLRAGPELARNYDG